MTVDRYTPPAPIPVDSWVAVLPDVAHLAELVADTEFVPKALRGKPAAVAAAILMGREVGEGPMTALSHLHVVDGRPAASAELWRRRAFAAGHEIRYPETTGTRVIAEGRRRGTSEWTRVVWTMDMARAAGLAGKSGYRAYPRQMLEARATSELCRLIFPDVLGATVYSAEEIADGYTVDAGEVTADAAPPAALDPPPRTARRAASGVSGAAGGPGTSGRAGRVRGGEAPPPPPAPTPVVDDPAGDAPPLPGEAGYDGPGPGAAQVAGPRGLADEPEREADDAEDTADRPVSRAQLTRLHALFGDVGWTDRADRLRAATAVVGRPLTSSKDLTTAEASALMDTLDRCQQTDDPQVAFQAVVRAAAAAAEHGEPDAAEAMRRRIRAARPPGWTDDDHELDFTRRVGTSIDAADPAQLAEYLRRFRGGPETSP